jgi:hypothetical protein
MEWGGEDFPGAVDADSAAGVFEAVAGIGNQPGIKV